MSLIFAVLGLGFLVFIHELGHYFMARKVGMKIEAFGIGFGKPLLKWNHKGVEWRLCWLPFGGYVKIAGMQKEKGQDLHQIEGGFFQKGPWARIQVAFMGPFVNICFALIAFTALWALGGRVKPFHQYTSRIGWVAPHTPLYEKGVRPGDEILFVDGKAYHSYQDLLYTLLTKEAPFSHITGYKIDYPIHRKTPFDYNVPIGEVTQEGYPQFYLSPAQYLLYPKQNFLKNQPLEASGIKPYDRLFWVNGEYVFSQSQLVSLLNEKAVFLTIEREGKILHSKIPLAKVGDLRLSSSQKAELDDWKHEAHLKEPLETLYFLPYFLNEENRVVKRIDFIDELDQARAFSLCQRCPYFYPLQPQDKVLAIQGKKVANSFDLLTMLQKRAPLIIVERNPKLEKAVPWQQADKDLDREVSLEALQPLVSKIGTPEEIKKWKDLYLLSSFEPLQAKQIVENASYYFSPTYPKEAQHQLLQELKKRPDMYLLGFAFEDRKVDYNPNPFTLCWLVIQDVGKTLGALVQGNLKMKFLSGPVGILQVVQQSWLLGVKEAIFWMGLISLNLALLNLLPIPILDGGHILFSVFEIVTKKRLSAKVMERLTIPFFLLLIAFFAYVTYHDIFRLVSKFF